MHIFCLPHSKRIPGFVKLSGKETDIGVEYVVLEDLLRNDRLQPSTNVTGKLAGPNGVSK